MTFFFFFKSSESTEHHITLAIKTSMVVFYDFYLKKKKKKKKKKIRYMVLSACHHTTHIYQCAKCGACFQKCTNIAYLGAKPLDYTGREDKQTKM